MKYFSAQTQLPPDEILDRAYRQFVETQGLVLIARAMHFHGTEGAVQIEVAGPQLVGKKSCDSRTAFAEIAAHVRETYGLTPIFMLLHLHATHEDDAGHLLVQADFGAPGMVRIETETYEREAHEFLDGLIG